MDRRIFVFLAVFLLFVSTGCNNQPAQDVQKALTAEEIRDKSIDAMEKATSYEFETEMNINTKLKNPEASPIGLREVDWTIEGTGKFDKKNKKMYMNMTMDMFGVKMNMEQYIIGDTQYIKMPMLGWVKNKTGEDIWSQEYAQMEVEFLRNGPVILEGTENVNSKECYVLKINPEVNDLMKLLSKSYQPGMSMNMRVDEMGDIVKSVELKEWIDKDTFLVSRMLMAMNMENENMTTNLVMTVDMHNYNEPMSIELTEDAKNAQGIASLGSGAMGTGL